MSNDLIDVFNEIIGKLDELVVKANDHEKKLHEISERMEKHENNIKGAQRSLCTVENVLHNIMHHLGNTT